MSGCLCARQLEQFLAEGDLPHESITVWTQHLAVCSDCAEQLDRHLTDARSHLRSWEPKVSEAPLAADDFDSHWPPPRCLASHPRWRIVDVLGAGGMGVVYLAADHSRLDTYRAIKLCHLQETRRATQPSRWERERRALAKLPCHPHLVKVEATEWLEGAPLFVMEYVPGVDLERWTESFTEGRVPIALAAAAVAQACAGLHAAWQAAGLVHRDIKPANLMRTPQGIVKVLDFGLARCLETPPDQRLTSQHQAAGTAAYSSPEQDRDYAAADQRSDIYSLGCTLFRLIVGHPVFGPETGQASAIEVRIAHHQQNPARVDALRKHVPRELATLIDDCLAKDPARRPASYVAVATRLLTLLEPADRLRVIRGFEGALAEDDAVRARVNERRRFHRWLTGTCGLAVTATCAVPWLIREGNNEQGWLAIPGEPDEWRLRLDGVEVPSDRWQRAEGADGEYRVPVPAGSHRLVITERSTGRSFQQAIEIPLQGVASLPPEWFAAPASESLSEAHRHARLAISSGRWEATSTELRHFDGEGEQWLLFGDPAWTDYDFSFEVFHEGFPVGISALFRCPTLENCTLFGMGWFDFQTATFAYSNAEHRHNRLGEDPNTYVKRLDWRVMPRQAYTFQVFVRGEQAECLVNGSTIFIAKPLPYATGCVGVRLYRNWEGQTTFRKLRVETPDRELLWEGIPRLS